MAEQIVSEVLEEEFEGTVLEEPNHVGEIAGELGLKNVQIEVVLEFMAEGATVPFVARYRKEKTGNLDEDNIRDIVDLKNKSDKLHKAKQTAVNGIESLGKMTNELMENILKASTLKQVEEIYKPYKSKKKTKAMVAIEKGFQVVADEMKKNIKITQEVIDDLSVGDDYIVPVVGDENIHPLQKHPLEDIIEGSQHIISAEVTAHADLRADLLETLQKQGNVVSKIKTVKSLEKLNQKDTDQIPKFDLYSDATLKISHLKPYQILALNRGENLGILGIKIDKSQESLDAITSHYAQILGIKTSFIETLQSAFQDGFDALFKSTQTELRGMLSEIGEDDAIATFRENLTKLLMTKPEYGKQILAIDPGFRAGCKMALLDELGNPLSFDKIFLHQKDATIAKLTHIITTQKPGVIVVGNGTGVNETIEILQSITDIEIFIVNESGASVYSASKIAKEEFPDLDSLDRGTISIGRRFIDPLSELVKVPVGSIGVGMYQHDIPEKKLEERLSYVVEDVVNDIGINVNTASSYVLGHIAGIDKRSAKKIYNHRPYASRAALKKQLSQSVYQQAAGFLRVPESKQVLDNTDIHPEQYELTQYMLDQDIGVPDFEENKTQLQEIYPDVNISTLAFIVESYESLGQEKRIHSTHKKATKLSDVALEEGDTTDGVVRNVVAFGAFVDIGMKNDGLVHVSQIADRFVSDPKTELEVGQTVRVKITSIDEKTGKIQLSIKQAK